MSAIERGDLVICVHVHCEKATHSYGMIKVVESVNPTPIKGRCPYCGKVAIGPLATFLSSAGQHYPLAWVRKIEPLTKKEEVSEVMNAIAPVRWKNPV